MLTTHVVSSSGKCSGIRLEIRKMTELHRFLDGSAVSAAVLALGLIACGGDGNAPGGGVYSAAGSSASVGGAVAAGSSGSRAVSPAAGSGGPTVVSGAAGTRAGGSSGSFSTGGAPGTVGGAGMLAAGGGAAGAGVTSGSTWTSQSNLDANGKLTPPAAADGFQLATPSFDLLPGQEVFKCYHVAVPNDAEFPVGEWDGQMSPGSHHFILYRSASDNTASDTLTDGACTQGFGGTTWLYTQGTPRSHLLFPDGVAMPLSAHEKLNFDMHYINTTSETLHAQVVLNVNKVKAAEFQKADAQISFNVSINVPAHGTQTVSGDCTPPPGAKYFVMQTHTHKHATVAVINRKLANGQMGEELVHTTNWDNPEIRVWHDAPFLTFEAGEKFHYSCTFQNDTNASIRVGVSADTNEMCMAEGYFFPASATTPSCN
jgi:hypothetical protein